MALDVYVGPLTRYYTGEWENVAERAARERGEAVARPAMRPARDVMRARVLDWREALARSLGERLAQPLDWDESARAHHVAGRPGWDGFGSLVLWAAYAEHPSLRRPPALPEAWDDDPALIRCNAEGFRSRYSHLVRNVELWLPCDFQFTFEGDDLNGRRIVMGSAQMLAQQLGELNAATWKMGATEVVSWGRRQAAHDAPLELQARYAFAIMTDLARQAVDHRLPIKLDY
ncbi:MAG: hypothetical protein JOY81_01850 [Alphaproteobacteria bacterium]|nr:hypothetical protein [Alphaproteobacteria bacterium]